jgi:hypothetical protein
MKLAYKGQISEGLEEDFIGNQGPQQTVVLEKEKEEEE